MNALAPPRVKTDTNALIKLVLLNVSKLIHVNLSLAITDITVLLTTMDLKALKAGL